MHRRRLRLRACGGGCSIPTSRSPSARQARLAPRSATGKRPPSPGSCSRLAAAERSWSPARPGPPAARAAARAGNRVPARVLGGPLRSGGRGRHRLVSRLPLAGERDPRRLLPAPEYPAGGVLLFALEAAGGGETRWTNAPLMVPFQLVCVWAVVAADPVRLCSPRSWPSGPRTPSTGSSSTTSRRRCSRSACCSRYARAGAGAASRSGSGRW